MLLAVHYIVVWCLSDWVVVIMQTDGSSGVGGWLRIASPSKTAIKKRKKRGRAKMYITDGRGKKGRTSDVPKKGEQDYNKKKETTTTLPCVFHGFSHYRPWRNSWGGGGGLWRWIGQYIDTHTHTMCIHI